MQTFNIDQLSDLDQIASIISEKSKEYKVFSFEGEMGAGKTTLITKVCNQLGINSHISSPTYAIVNTYDTPQQEEVYHFDFYRLENEQEAIESGLDEMIDSGNICLMEWAQNISKLLPDNYVRIKISETGITSRQIEITLLQP